jgi:hypothetical protein
MKKHGAKARARSESYKSLMRMLAFFPYMALFGTNSSYKNKTHWITFRKDERLKKILVRKCSRNF